MCRRECSSCWSAPDNRPHPSVTDEGGRGWSWKKKLLKYKKLWLMEEVIYHFSVSLRGVGVELQEGPPVGEVRM